MAKALMGAIVVKLAGKLNGHCFRVLGNTQVLQAKPLPSRKLNITVNGAMPIIRDLFAKWITLDSATRNLWKSIALTYPFSDRWGNPKYLTGRQFFTKVNINAVLAQFSEVDPTTFNAYIPGLEFDSVSIETTSHRLELKNEHLAPGTTLQICIKKLNNEAINPDPSKIKTICYIKAADYTPADLYHSVVTSGFTFVTGQWYAVSVSAVSPFGMKSPFMMYLAEAVAI
jgi:hypothetical protein